jgi:putative peptidoglycan lipid II flippase
MKLLHLPSKSITGAALVISATTLISRFMGILRDRVLAHQYSTGQIIDAYYAAFKIPDLIYNLLIVGALTAGFIPTFTKLLEKDKTKAWQLASNILNIIGISLIVLCTAGMFFSPEISNIIAPGFNESGKALVSTFTKIIFLSPIFLGISMVMGGILQSLRHFFIYSIAPLFYNLGIILGATILVPLLHSSTGLAWGVVLGAFMHCSIQVYGALRSGFRWSFYLNLKDEATRTVGRLMIPRTLGLAITQFNSIIITVIASTLPMGSIAVYNYAGNIQAVPAGLIGIPFALAVFPLLSINIATNNKMEFNKNISSTLRQILFLIIPLSIVFLLLRAQIVRVILGSGRFNWTDTINTANALAFFSFGLFAQSLLPVLARAFYALSDTMTPFVIGIVSELISIIFAILAMQPTTKSLHWFYGINGLALASAIGVILNVLTLFIFLRRKTGDLEDQKIISLIYKTVLAGIGMGITIQLFEQLMSKIVDMERFWGVFMHGLFSGLAGLCVYVIICYTLRVDEVAHIASSMKKKWLRIKNVPEILPDHESV